MAGDFDITLHESFARELRSLANVFRAWDRESSVNLRKTMRVICQRFRAEAIKRVPVGHMKTKQGNIVTTGQLKKLILDEVEELVSGVIGRVGTNIPYGVYTEFGTEYIAGGRVKALGDGVDITDAQAIKDWPAKRVQPVQGEQMPWLRPAFNAIKPWAIEKLNAVLNPPNSSSGAA